MAKANEKINIKEEHTDGKGSILMTKGTVAKRRIVLQQID